MDPQEFNFVWQIYVREAGTSDEHIEACALDVQNMAMLRAPLFFKETEHGDFRERLRIRIEHVELPCTCTKTVTCSWHEQVYKKWNEEDEDAIDSWREARGDADAFARRINRKMKEKAEVEPDDVP